MIHEGPLVARVDVEEISNVLLNLILNAFDASSENQSVTVEVLRNATGEPGFKVSDQG